MKINTVYHTIYMDPMGCCEKSQISGRVAFPREFPALAGVDSGWGQACGLDADLEGGDLSFGGDEDEEDGWEVVSFFLWFQICFIFNLTGVNGPKLTIIFQLG